MKLTPLGDQAVLAYLADEPAAVALAATVRAADPVWLFDVVPAYASVGVFFDADQIRAADVMDWLNALASGGRGPAEAVLGGNAHSGGSRPPLAFRVPVCYEMQLDLARVCEHTGLSADAVIERHTATVYTVYAVGFVPGFPYLGYLPSELCGVGRLPSPRTRVEPGSVGLTGRQTGIYPLARPGGWNLIGRTPLTIVDAADGFFPLRVGDTVRFDRIDESRYRQLEGERLG
ncbi:allophanate hydrolase subunit 1 [Gemmata sp. JC717]|uniref:5-oxoprolinase subunit B family protein n=1 Tax=Gemmata algarum TaxID=2975278 RepID=UPI0021BB365B|nr:allophanate hydrolase subunit 1 [Gemmata algarum]MDY3554860.1 allophanate hydrolase subunit 1 [Gemmata algarum]